MGGFDADAGVGGGGEALFDDAAEEVDVVDGEQVRLLAFEVVLELRLQVGQARERGPAPVAAGFGLGFLSAHAVQQELALGRLAVIAVKGFPVMRQWYLVHRRDRRLPRITEAFQRFIVKEGARLIRNHEKAMA